MRAQARRWQVLGALTALLMVAAGCSDDEPAADEDDSGSDEEAGEAGGGGQAEGGLLAEVRERGTLQLRRQRRRPGVRLRRRGRRLLRFDIDFCRVIAAAVLGDAEAVEFTPLTADQRFTALQAGEIDVLVRNTTLTASRDGGEGAAFATTTFYDGQGDDGPRPTPGSPPSTTWPGRTICVLSGTTTELNLAARFDAAGIPYTPLSFQDNDQLQTAFVAGQCDGWTSDKSQLAGRPVQLPGRGGRARVAGDPGRDLLQGASRAGRARRRQRLVRRRELGGDRHHPGRGVRHHLAERPARRTSGTDPNVLALPRSAGRRGRTPCSTPVSTSSPTSRCRTSSQVGNYGEIYDRNVGAGSNARLDRGLNALWTDGGLLYAPPYR